MNEEHGFVVTERVSRRFGIGGRSGWFPITFAPQSNLHDVVYAVRNDEVVDVWVVKGRGKLQ